MHIIRIFIDVQCIVLYCNRCATPNASTYILIRCTICTWKILSKHIIYTLFCIVNNRLTKITILRWPRCARATVNLLYHRGTRQTLYILCLTHRCGYGYLRRGQWWARKGNGRMNKRKTLTLLKLQWLKYYIYCARQFYEGL